LIPAALVAALFVVSAPLNVTSAAAQPPAPGSSEPLDTWSTVTVPLTTKGLVHDGTAIAGGATHVIVDVQGWFGAAG
jgi:hypothetical protein